MKELVQGTTTSPTTLQDQRNLELAGRIAIRMPKRRGSNQRTEVGGQRSEVGGQRSEVRGKKRRKGFSCGSGFPRPACPGRSPGEPVEGQPRSCALNDFYGFYDFYDLTDSLSP